MAPTRSAASSSDHKPLQTSKRDFVVKPPLPYLSPRYTHHLAFEVACVTTVLSDVSVQRRRRRLAYAVTAVARSSLVANILCRPQVAISMGQPTESPTSAGAMLSSSPLNWDGKCQKCRKLMSRCVCFQETEGDADLLHTSAAFQETADASETRPLWNALRKMHRKSTATRLSLLQPPTNSQPSKENHRKRSEALPPLSAPHLHRRSDARPPKSSTGRGSREPSLEPAQVRSSMSRKDRLQRAGITTSSHNLKRGIKDAGVMRSVQSTSSMGKHNGVNHVSRPNEKLSYGPEEGSPSDDENDENVWELTYAEYMYHDLSEQITSYCFTSTSVR
ncbi:hypothetical protein PC129_g17722 [Phytophthora cactorum]|uniref:Uncharacterized protein n=1 Tax=Phytophthora cactorum TaxID=29920 RepID=A0A8T0Z615_9STRA|nr:hypothetical protein PC112_g16956 [Phytophthora cactorum]KAG2857687.1 hypothetical protein PC113_g10458 [Phytophthora cactorum]KAG2882946.1 hypothetical protein PC114_g20784 [Phytophthora cactorum]KAG2922267.1 hypothetical protein PC117_g16021 [Phytophthora cactorum]KAG2984917.1 hypothetical protein PC119_g20276 [Phytophthora cactorum]